MTCDLSNYSEVKAIGQGKYSIVFKAIRSEDGTLCALKKVHERYLRGGRTKERVLQEVELLKSLDHVNIIKHRDAFFQNGELYIELAWAGGGDLKLLMKRLRHSRQLLSERKIWEYFIQLASAVEHMHSRRILHRDLKPANIFLTEDNVIKVGDLGLGRYLNQYSIEAHSRVGTPLYMAPEVLEAKTGYDFKSDVWSLGCMLYELACLISPFKANLPPNDLVQLISNICSGKYPKIPDSLSLSSSLTDLVDSMLTLDPDSRPDSKFILGKSVEMAEKYLINLPCLNNVQTNFNNNIHFSPVELVSENGDVADKPSNDYDSSFKPILENTIGHNPFAVGNESFSSKIAVESRAKFNNLMSDQTQVSTTQHVSNDTLMDNILNRFSNCVDQLVSNIVDKNEFTIETLDSCVELLSNLELHIRNFHNLNVSNGAELKKEHKLKLSTQMKSLYEVVTSIIHNEDLLNYLHTSTKMVLEKLFEFRSTDVMTFFEPIAKQLMYIFQISVNESILAIIEDWMTSIICQVPSNNMFTNVINQACHCSDHATQKRAILLAVSVINHIYDENIWNAEYLQKSLSNIQNLLCVAFCVFKDTIPNSVMECFFSVLSENPTSDVLWCCDLEPEAVQQLCAHDKSAMVQLDRRILECEKPLLSASLDGDNVDMLLTESKEDRADSRIEYDSSRPKSLHEDTTTSSPSKPGHKKKKSIKGVIKSVKQIFRHKDSSSPPSATSNQTSDLTLRTNESDLIQHTKSDMQLPVVTTPPAMKRSTSYQSFPTPPSRIRNNEGGANLRASFRMRRSSSYSAAGSQTASTAPLLLKLSSSNSVVTPSKPNVSPSSKRNSGRSTSSNNWGEVPTGLNELKIPNSNESNNHNLDLLNSPRLFKSKTPTQLESPLSTGHSYARGSNLLSITAPNGTDDENNSPVGFVRSKSQVISPLGFIKEEDDATSPPKKHIRRRSSSASVSSRKNKTNKFGALNINTSTSPRPDDTDNINPGAYSFSLWNKAERDRKALQQNFLGIVTSSPGIDGVNPFAAPIVDGGNPYAITPQFDQKHPMSQQSTPNFDQEHPFVSKSTNDNQAAGPILYHKQNSAVYVWQNNYDDNDELGNSSRLSISDDFMQLVIETPDESRHHDMTTSIASTITAAFSPQTTPKHSSSYSNKDVYTMSNDEDEFSDEQVGVDFDDSDYNEDDYDIHKHDIINYRKGDLLGTGTFASVFIGLDEDTGQFFAIKEMLINSETTSDSAIRTIEREIQMYRTLHHEHLISYLGTDLTKQGVLNIFLEYCKGESIDKMLKKFGNFNEHLIRLYTRQIISALNFLHDANINGVASIVHRDIKGANVLITDKDGQGCAKLADFGCSLQAPSGNPNESDNLEESLVRLRGTLLWMAPEAAKQCRDVTCSSDIWSVGATVIEMSTGMPPWSHLKEQYAQLFHVAKCTEPPEFPAALSSLAKNFLSRCMCINPSERWTAKQLLGHPFLNEEASNNSARNRRMSAASRLARRRSSSITSVASLNIQNSPTPKTKRGSRLSLTSLNSVSPRHERAHSNQTFTSYESPRARTTSLSSPNLLLAKRRSTLNQFFEKYIKGEVDYDEWTQICHSKCEFNLPASSFYSYLPCININDISSDKTVERYTLSGVNELRNYFDMIKSSNTSSTYQIKSYEINNISLIREKNEAVVNWNIALYKQSIDVIIGTARFKYDSNNLITDVQFNWCPYDFLPQNKSRTRSKSNVEIPEALNEVTDVQEALADDTSSSSSSGDEDEEEVHSVHSAYYTIDPSSKRNSLKRYNSNLSIASSVTPQILPPLRVSNLSRRSLPKRHLSNHMPESTTNSSAANNLGSNPSHNNSDNNLLRPASFYKTKEVDGLQTLVPVPPSLSGIKNKQSSKTFRTRKRTVSSSTQPSSRRNSFVNNNFNLSSSDELNKSYNSAHEDVPRVA